MALAACSSISTKFDMADTQKSAKVLTVQGGSQLPKQAHLTEQQNRFELEQAATINAYRKLAGLLYKEILADDLLVADQVIKAEAFRIYVDLFLREANVIGFENIYEQKKVSLALTLSPRFYQCVSTTVTKVSQCLLEDNKIPFTRIGYQKSPVSTVNLSCYGCSSQFSIAGFSKEKDIVSRVMLEAGFYDVGWLSNMAATAIARYWFITNSVFN